MKLLNKISYRASYTFSFIAKTRGIGNQLKMLMSSIIICLPVKPFADSHAYHLLVKLLRGVQVNQNGFIFELNDPKDLRMIGNKYEKETTHWFTDRPNGDVFIDVGANIGRYAIFLSGRYRKVLAFEPITFKLLERNIELNNLENVTPYNLALLEKERMVPFYFNNEYLTISSIHERVSLNHRREVPAAAFDELYDGSWGRVDLVKIDVEGSEYEVLKGMSGTIKKYKPKLIVEIWPQMFEKVNDYLNSLGYTHVERHRARYLYIPKTY